MDIPLWFPSASSGFEIFWKMFRTWAVLPKAFPSFLFFEIATWSPKNLEKWEKNSKLDLGKK